MSAPPHPPSAAGGPETSKLGTLPSRQRLNRRIVEIAARQHGVVTLRQLRQLGLSGSAVRSRVGNGALYAIYEGVYAVGAAWPTRESKYMAAVMACGSGAVLSHRSAAALWRLRDDKSTSIDVTAPNRRGRVPQRISAHRDSSLTSEDRTNVQGIPCTTVARTLLDFAAVAQVWELRKAVSEAEVLRILDHDAVWKLIRRCRGRRGVARLRLVMDAIHPRTKWARSDMEIAFLDMCERAGLPEPKVNVTLCAGGRRIMPDFLWGDARLIVEADSREYHDTGSAFESDREREQRLQLAGWRVSRCTWRQIEREPRRLAETVRSLLKQGRRA